jgi:hypothetical protein
MLNKVNIEDLIEIQSSQEMLATIYIPTHINSGAGHLQDDRIRFKNQIQEISNQFKNIVEHTPKRDPFTHRLHKLYEDMDFWRHRNVGLALFLTPTEIYYHDLTIEPTSFSYVGDKFILSPLLTIRNMSVSRLVLSLNLTSPKLYLATVEGLQDITPGEMPAEMHSALRIDEYEQEQQFHASGPNGSNAVYHGHGASKDNSESEVKNYIDLVWSAIEQQVRSYNLKLMVAGTTNHRALISDKIPKDKLDSVSIDGSFKDEHKLYEKVREHLFNSQENKFKQLNNHIKTNSVEYDESTSSEVLTAATDGRIQNFALRIIRKTKDTIRPANNERLLIDLSQIKDNLSALEPVVQSVYKTSGTVIGLIQSRNKKQSLAVASMRY